MLKPLAIDNPNMYFVYDLVGKIPQDAEDFIRHLLKELNKYKEKAEENERDLPRLEEKVRAVYAAKEAFASALRGTRQANAEYIKDLPKT